MFCSDLLQSLLGAAISITFSRRSVFLNSFPAASLTNLDAQFLTGKSNSLSNTTANSEFLKPRILVAVKSYPTSCAVELPFYKTAVKLACTKSCFGPALFGSSETTHERKGLARTVICGEHLMMMILVV